MEDVLLSWPVEAPTLEPLQPLSFSVLDDQETSINLDKLSRSEIAGKLLDHLDQIADGQVYFSVFSEKTAKSRISVVTTGDTNLPVLLFETEPFDWFTTEKSIDLPIFENISPGIQNHSISNNTTTFVSSNKQSDLASTHYTYFDSPEYEPTFAPTNYAFGDAASSVVPGTTTIQPQLTYAPSCGTTVGAMTNNPPSPPVEAAPCSPPFVDVDPKGEVLTPPESPKEEDILQFLQEFNPQDWEKLMLGGERAVPVAATNASTTSTTVSENSYPIDDLSDYAASSPYVGSESSSDNDADYVPPRGGGGGSGRKMSGSLVPSSRRRASKPYSRQSVEERKMRKKEQNKNAATRYRMKKKQEVEESKNEEKRLTDRNRELRRKLDDVGREIKCLKSLMRDVYRKKGLIN